MDRRQALWKTSVLMEGFRRCSPGRICSTIRKQTYHWRPEARKFWRIILATGLTLRAHPLTFLRSRLKAAKAITAAELKKTPAGKTVLVAGLVLFRQHPQTAKETIFITMEDETGAVNLIVWKHVHEKFHEAVYHGKLLACRGVVQREGQVLHVVARGVWDWSALLKHLDPQEGAPALPCAQSGFSII